MHLNLASDKTAPLVSAETYYSRFWILSPVSVFLKSATFSLVYTAESNCPTCLGQDTYHTKFRNLCPQSVSAETLIILNSGF